MALKKSYCVNLDHFETSYRNINARKMFLGIKACTNPNWYTGNTYDKVSICVAPRDSTAWCSDYQNQCTSTANSGLPDTLNSYDFLAHLNGGDPRSQTFTNSNFIIYPQRMSFRLNTNALANNNTFTFIGNSPDDDFVLLSHGDILDVTNHIPYAHNITFQNLKITYDETTSMKALQSRNFTAKYLTFKNCKFDKSDDVYLEFTSEIVDSGILTIDQCQKQMSIQLFNFSSGSSVNYIDHSGFEFLGNATSILLDGATSIGTTLFDISTPGRENNLTTPFPKSDIFQITSSTTAMLNIVDSNSEAKLEVGDISYSTASAEKIIISNEGTTSLQLTSLSHNLQLISGDSSLATSSEASIITGLTLTMNVSSFTVKGDSFSIPTNQWSGTLDISASAISLALPSQPGDASCILTINGICTGTSQVVIDENQLFSLDPCTFTCTISNTNTLLVNSAVTNVDIQVKKMGLYIEQAVTVKFNSKEISTFSNPKPESDQLTISQDLVVQTRSITFDGIIHFATSQIEPSLLLEVGQVQFQAKKFTYGNPKVDKYPLLWIQKQGYASYTFTDTINVDSVTIDFFPDIASSTKFVIDFRSDLSSYLGETITLLTQSSSPLSFLTQQLSSPSITFQWTSTIQWPGYPQILGFAVESNRFLYGFNNNNLQLTFGSEKSFTEEKYKICVLKTSTEIGCHLTFTDSPTGPDPWILADRTIPSNLLVLILVTDTDLMISLKDITQVSSTYPGLIFSMFGLTVNEVKPKFHQVSAYKVGLYDRVQTMEFTNIVFPYLSELEDNELAPMNPSNRLFIDDSCEFLPQSENGKRNAASQFYYNNIAKEIQVPFSAAIAPDGILIIQLEGTTPKVEYITHGLPNGLHYSEDPDKKAKGIGVVGNIQRKLTLTNSFNITTVWYTSSSTMLYLNNQTEKPIIAFPNYYEWEYILINKEPQAGVQAYRGFDNDPSVFSITKGIFIDNVNSLSIAGNWTQQTESIEAETDMNGQVVIGTTQLNGADLTLGISAGQAIPIFSKTGNLVLSVDQTPSVTNPSIIVLDFTQLGIGQSGSVDCSDLVFDSDESKLSVLPSTVEFKVQNVILKIDSKTTISSLQITKSLSVDRRSSLTLAEGAKLTFGQSDGKAPTVEYHWREDGLPSIPIGGETEVPSKIDFILDVPNIYLIDIDVYNNKFLTPNTIFTRIQKSADGSSQCEKFITQIKSDLNTQWNSMTDDVKSQSLNPNNYTFECTQSPSVTGSLLENAQYEDLTFRFAEEIEIDSKYQIPPILPYKVSNNQSSNGLVMIIGLGLVFVAVSAVLFFLLNFVVKRHQKKHKEENEESLYESSDSQDSK